MSYVRSGNVDGDVDGDVDGGQYGGVYAGAARSVVVVLGVAPGMVCVHILHHIAIQTPSTTNYSHGELALSTFPNILILPRALVGLMLFIRYVDLDTSTSTAVPTGLNCEPCNGMHGVEI